MLVHVAENGLSFELDCQPSTSVEDVQSYLVALTGVPQHDQLLIVGDTRLESHRSLGSYNLPGDGSRAVFLFNRHRLSPECPPPEPESGERFAEALSRSLNLNLQVAAANAGNGHLLDESRDPALRALPSYERQFKLHLDKGRLIHTLSQKKFEACRMLLREQQVQEMALETARANMEYYYKMIDQLYQEFMRNFTRQHRVHGELLSSFDRDLDRLRRCKLHPGLRSESRKSLIDCVKEGSLKKWAEECALSHKQFFGKVSQLKNEYIILQRSVEDLLVTGSTVDVQLLAETIEDHRRFTEEQGSILQSLSKDVNTVRKLIDDCANDHYSPSLRPHDAVSALGPMYDVHDKSHLPRMESCDLQLRKLLESCRSSKNEMSLGVHMRMQNVAALQANIRDMRNQLSAFREAMDRQKQIFEELKLVRRVGSSYKACLAEVIRRKASMKLYMGQAGQLAEKLARKREEEMARREEFVHTHSVYIPGEVMAAMGLFDAPSQCIVNIAPFDLGLLDIDVGDLEHLAPESVAGALYKVNEGSPSTDDTGELEEIAGTSRLEVENTWLKAELASAISTLCNLDPEFELGEGGGGKLDTETRARKAAEAMSLKDQHAKQLQGMLEVRQGQCQAYEKRIRELEHRLREQHSQIVKLSERKAPEQFFECSESSILTSSVARISSTAEPMDEGNVSGRRNINLVGSSCTEASDQTTEEVLDENMVETTQGTGAGDVSMTEIQKDEHPHAKVGAEKEKIVASMEKSVTVKLSQSSMDSTADLLRECQMNCAHLENRLHEAREEARTNLCAAERRAAEYSALRSSSVRLRGLMERLKNCISGSPEGPSGLVDSLLGLSASLSSSGEASDDPGLVELQASIRLLADRVSALAQQRLEAIERCNSMELAQSHLNKDAESRAELLKNLYAKHKLQKQISKEKICFTRFEVHQLAAFMRNSAGHWEALNGNCPNYYLSDESVALFLENSGPQQCIVGQIVHINRNVTRPPPSPSSSSSSSTGEGETLSSSPPGAGAGGVYKPRFNPYGLPIGSEYFVVTVAMVPDMISTCT